MSALTRTAAAVLCTFVAASAMAQQRARSVQVVPNAVPSAAARSAQAAPRPTGLTPIFPAGISSGSGAAVSRDPLAASTTPIPRTGGSLATTAVVPTEVPPLEAAGVVTELQFGGAVTSTGVPVTAVMGAGAGATVRGPGQRAAGGAGGFSAVDTARSFFFADGNHDGELTRSEFNRLSIATMTFEEMDRNFDQIISRFEFDDSVR